MNRRQQNVTVVAVGLAIFVVTTALNTWLDGRAVIDGGWFNYAPNNGVVFEPATDVGVILRRAAVWLVGIAAFVAISFRLLGRTPDS
ncbi:MAG: hypothetical protein AAF467_12865 [Actinomycetota bacterium]